MCGVFGFVADKGKEMNLERIEKIARATEKRGRHAFGFAWIDSRGRMRSYKQTGRITDHLSLLSSLAVDARVLIGHCRFATQGDPENNLNNHPFACDGGFFVHNGTIPLYEDLIDEYDLHPLTRCDSEVLGLLIEQWNGGLLDRCATAVQAVADRPTVMLGIWNNPVRLVAVRHVNPLMIGRARTGVYLASLPVGLPSKRRCLRDGSATMFRFNRKGDCRVEEKTIRVAADVSGGTVCETDSVSADGDSARPCHEVLRAARFN